MHGEDKLPNDENHFTEGVNLITLADSCLCYLLCFCLFVCCVLFTVGHEFLRSNDLLDYES